MRKKFIYSVIALCSVFAAPVMANVPDDLASATLRPGWQMADEHYIAAINITLAQGWKTYWRNPGDTGIPPRFNWSGSQNIKDVRIIWPRPELFMSAGQQTIGYHDRLLLPIEITPQDPSQPIDVNLVMDIGVCENICVPVTLKMSRSIAPSLPQSTVHDSAIVAALMDHPLTAQEAGLTAAPSSCIIMQNSEGVRVRTEVDVPSLGESEVLVFESNQPDMWASSGPTKRNGTRLSVETDLYPLDDAPIVLARADITLTAIGSDNKAVEISGCPSP